MERKWTFRYGSAAVLTAIAIIAVSLLVNPSLLTRPANASASFTVMLTDPPTVPAGTTMLNLTYSGIQLHVTYPNGTIEWLPVQASGTVNLFSLINMSQTLASTAIPVGSIVDKIQFTIADVDAEVNGATHNVTVLSSTLVIKVADGHVNQTLSGVLLDFHPTLVQIQATDANGTGVDYYVLVPSATAVIIKDLSEDQLKVGTIVKIGERNKVKLLQVEEEFRKNVTIVSASLKVSGNTSTLSVVLENDGDFAFRVFGLTLHGEFNSTRIWDRSWKTHDDYDDDFDEETKERIHPRTLPFKLTGSTLVPLFGTNREHEDERKHEDEHEYGKFSSILLQPKESVTLTFSNIITFKPDDNKHYPSTIITPIVGENYALRLMGEGSQTFSLTASS